MFPRDDETAHLLRESTRFKDLGDMTSALTCLAQAKQLMLVSEVTYPIETWGKYPRYLMDAGKFDEAIEELTWMLEDLPRRMAKEYYVDNPDVCIPRAKKLRNAKAGIRRPTEVIGQLLARANLRIIKVSKKKPPLCKPS